MKPNKGMFVGLFILLAGIFVFFGLRGETSGKPAQSNSVKPATAQSESLVKLSSPAKPATEAVSKLPAFDAAALENVKMQSDLTWVFGGKSQRGWRLYTPLISQMIEADTDAQTSNFALAVSRWQKEKGLDSHGVLDSSTWFQMISAWQSDRIKDRTYPTEAQLLTIPVSECYDPSRPEELRKVERETYLAYKQMLRAAAADLRKQSPNSGRAGLAVNSPHFTGRALDIYVGGEPVDTKDANRALQTETRAYRWLVKNASRFGFRPYFYEPWHWEYVGKK